MASYVTRHVRGVVKRNGCRKIDVMDAAISERFGALANLDMYVETLDRSFT